MIRSHRSQLGDDFEEMSLATAISDFGEESPTRQEFKDDSDINTILARFGALPPQRPPQFGVVDFDVDFRDAVHAVAEARMAFEALSPATQAKYGSWEGLAAAIEAYQEPAPTPEGVSPEGGGAAPPAGAPAQESA